MRILGEFCLLAAFVGSGYAACACVLGGWRGHRGIVRSGYFAALASSVSVVIVLLVLAAALLTNDFRYDYVVHYSSQRLSWHYRLSRYLGGASRFVAALGCDSQRPGHRLSLLRDRHRAISRYRLWPAQSERLLSAGGHGVCRRSDEAESCRATQWGRTESAPATPVDADSSAHRFLGVRGLGRTVCTSYGSVAPGSRGCMVPQGATLVAIRLGDSGAGILLGATGPTKNLAGAATGVGTR